MRIKLKRIYHKAAKADGYRVLVDGMWPRGIAKRDAGLDDWCKNLAPTKNLRQWFGHDPDRWHEFVHSYRCQLHDRDLADTLAELRAHANDEGLTLLFAARETRYNHAVALKHYLEDTQ